MIGEINLANFFLQFGQALAGQPRVVLLLPDGKRRHIRYIRVTHPAKLTRAPDTGPAATSRSQMSRELTPRRHMSERKSMAALPTQNPRDSAPVHFHQLDHRARPRRTRADVQWPV